MTLKVKVSDSRIQYQSRKSQDAYLVNSSSNPLQVIARPNFLEFWIKIAQNDPEGQGKWPLFSIPAESIIWCMSGANFVIPALEFWVKMVKITLKVKVNDP